MLLAVQRGPESSHPWQWEFAGGKIHPDETAQECIVRECIEELCVRIEIIAQLESVEFDYSSKQTRLIPFVCKISSGEITLTEHSAQHWFSIDQWKAIDWLGADHELIIKNQESLRQILVENL